MSSSPNRADVEASRPQMTYDNDLEFYVPDPDDAPQYEPFETDLYEAVIKGIEDAGTSPFDPSKEQLKVEFEVVDEDAQDGAFLSRTISKWYTKFTNQDGALALPERAGITKLINAALNNGKPLEKGTRFGMTTLVGKRVRIDVEQYAGKDKDGNPRTKSKVIGVKPSAIRRRAAAAEPVRRVRSEIIDPDDLPFD